MNATAAIEYIHSVNRTFCKPGLERIEALCHALGDPQDRLPFVHVAGTNGKGSFCAMLTSVLSASGLRVGRFTSPYVKSFCERISIGNTPIPEEQLAALVERVRPTVDAMPDPPTEFELITALGFLYFLEEGCDLVVLECGLGGRLDATNLIRTPILSVITGIALDHTAFLGETHADIAREKAGILRPGVPALWCGHHPDADAVIRTVAAKIDAPINTVDHTALTIHRMELSGTTFDFAEWRQLQLPLLGSYQPRNAANVLSAVVLLRKAGYRISDDAVREGLLSTVWHARFELLSASPLVIADGGHNPEGIDAAVESIRAYFGTRRVLVLSGVMADKDYSRMSDAIATVASRVYCITPPNPRSLPAAEYAKEFVARQLPAMAYASLEEALKDALNEAARTDTPLLCLGSLYLYGSLCEALEAHGGRNG